MKSRYFQSWPIWTQPFVGAMPPLQFIPQTSAEIIFNSFYFKKCPVIPAVPCRYSQLLFSSCLDTEELQLIWSLHTSATFLTSDEIGFVEMLSGHRDKVLDEGVKNALYSKY